MYNDNIIHPPLSRKTNNHFDFQCTRGWAYNIIIMGITLQLPVVAGGSLGLAGGKENNLRLG